MSSPESLEFLEVSDPDQYLSTFQQVGYEWTHETIGGVIVRELFKAEKVELGDGRNLEMRNIAQRSDYKVHALDDAIRSGWPASHVPFTGPLLDTPVTIHSKNQSPRLLPIHVTTGFRGVMGLVGELEVSVLSHETEGTDTLPEARRKRLEAFNLEALRLTQLLRGIPTSEPLLPFFQAAVRLRAGDVGFFRGEPNPIHFTTRIMENGPDDPAGTFGRF